MASEAPGESQRVVREGSGSGAVGAMPVQETGLQAGLPPVRVGPSRGPQLTFGMRVVWKAREGYEAGAHRTMRSERRFGGHPASRRALS